MHQVQSEQSRLQFEDSEGEDRKTYVAIVDKFHQSQLMLNVFLNCFFLLILFKIKNKSDSFQP